MQISMCPIHFPLFVPPFSLFTVLVYASDFVERQEQPEGFLLHKTSLLMQCYVHIQSMSNTWSPFRESYWGNRTLPQISTFYLLLKKKPISTLFHWHSDIFYTMLFLLLLIWPPLQEGSMCNHKALVRVRILCQQAACNAAASSKVYVCLLSVVQVWLARKCHVTAFYQSSWKSKLQQTKK